jgi:hypothetical protein
MPIVLRKKVKVTMHLPAGYTRVLFDDSVSVGGISVDIPTDAIPFHLRGIGSEFIMIATTLTGQAEAEKMTPEEIRRVQTVSIEEIKHQ